MKRWLAALSLFFGALILAATATGCGGGGGSNSSSSDTNASSGKSGGTFRLGTASGIDSLNPYVAFNQDAYSAFEYIYPVLIQYDSNLHYAPFFAKSWHASNGGKTWTFKTQPNAKWSDGKPLTAADAAWTINTDIKYASGGAANAAGLVNHIKNATAPNATTLVVNYDKAPGPTWVLGQFQQFFILPQHIWAQHTGNKGADLKTFPNNAPVVGSGPFTLVKFKKNNIAIFKRNDSYWGTKPKIDEFGLQQFSDDDAMVTALKANDLDAIEAVPATAMKTLRNAGFEVSDVPGLDQTDFIINSNPNKKEHRELLDLKVKEAFDHAIDRQKIDDVTWLGAAQPANSIIPATTGALAQPAPQDRELRPDAREQAPRPGWVQEGLGWDPRRERPEDVLQRHRADRRPEHPAHVPDHPDRLQQDRRAAEGGGARLDRRLRQDDQPRTTRTRASTWRCGTGSLSSTPTSCSRS